MLKILKNIWPAKKEKAVVKAEVPKAPLLTPLTMKVNREAITKAEAAKAFVHPAFNIPKPPPGVVPEGGQTMAMDDSISGQYAWASMSSALTEGLGFMGYPYLAELSQRPEYRRISETIAKEMTRKWIKLQSVGEDNKTEKLAAIEAEMKRLKVQHAFRELAELDGFFGRAHLYLDTGDSDNHEELKTTLGDGSSALTAAKVNQTHRLKRVAVIEPVWTYPNAYNASDPLRTDYFTPTSWFVQGRLIHSTRLLTFVGREVPDLLKAAYSFGGLSLSQMSKPYIDNWLRTRQAVSDLIYKFSTTVLKTNMSGVLTGGAGEDMVNRAALFNAYHDNHGLMMIDMTTEDFVNVSVPLGSLDHLQAQSQEHMAAVSGIPLVKLLGITPSGLNASSDGEMRCFYDWIEASQEALMTDHLSTVINLIQLSLFGVVDPDIGFKWEPLWTLDDAALANARKVEMDTDVEAINAGIILPQEARTRLASEEDSAYSALDLEAPLPAPVAGAVPPGGPEDDPAGGVAAPPSAAPGASSANNPFTSKKPAVGGSAGGSKAPISQDADFVEAEHPRDKIGEFATASSAGQKKSSFSGELNGTTARTTEGSLRDRGSVSGSAGELAAPSGTTAGNGAVSTEPLKGLPSRVKVPGMGEIEVGPLPAARQAAADYMKTTGLPYDPPTEYVKVDAERAAKIAGEYDRMKHDPQNPEVKAAYAKMISEVEGQYEAVLKTGLKIDFIDFEKDGDPYAASPRLAYLDVKNNNHLWVFSTKDGFGSSPMDVSDNPLLAETKYQISGQPALANDLFRAVHDYFGHFKEGVGFRADGEENAWRSHSAMFSPLARRAMTSETRGQNSWVNFGPHGAENKTASSATTVFADQKTGLLPEWVSNDGSGQTGA